MSSVGLPKVPPLIKITWLRPPKTPLDKEMPAHAILLDGGTFGGVGGIKLNIDWNKYEARTENTPLDLREVAVGESHVITFHEVKALDSGALVATVESETIEGSTLWLAGAYGPQNGLLSLMKAADGGDNIEGGTFRYEKVASDKSPAGYAHRWTVE